MTVYVVMVDTRDEECSYQFPRAVYTSKERADEVCRIILGSDVREFELDADPDDLDWWARSVVRDA